MRREYDPESNYKLEEDATKEEKLNFVEDIKGDLCMIRDLIEMLEEEDIDKDNHGKHRNRDYGMILDEHLKYLDASAESLETYWKLMDD